MKEIEVKEIDAVATEEITETKNADVETVEATTEEVK